MSHSLALFLFHSMNVYVALSFDASLCVCVTAHLCRMILHHSARPTHYTHFWYPFYLFICYSPPEIAALADSSVRAGNASIGFAPKSRAYWIRFWGSWYQFKRWIFSFLFLISYGEAQWRDVCAVADWIWRIYVCIAVACFSRCCCCSVSSVFVLI